MCNCRLGPVRALRSWIGLSSVVDGRGALACPFHERLRWAQALSLAARSQGTTNSCKDFLWQPAIEEAKVCGIAHRERVKNLPDALEFRHVNKGDSSSHEVVEA